MAESCYDCGGRTAPRLYRHTTRIAGVDVVDTGRPVPTCLDCGAVSMSLATLASFERRAAELVFRTGSTITGETMRFARKALGLMQSQLADLLGCATETVSRWECNRLEVPPDVRWAMVGVLLTVENQGRLS